MMFIAQGGASAVRVELIVPIQASSSSSERALFAGNEPMIPLLQAASTMSTPETRNIGAAMVSVGTRKAGRR